MANTITHQDELLTITRVSEGTLDTLVQALDWGADVGERPRRRIVEASAAVVLLILFAPLMLLIALLIKIDSRGPVFYAQVRTGRDRRSASRRLRTEVSRVSGRRSFDWGGRLFRVLKFRSMGVNAEVNGPQWCKENDPRVTRMGRWLRKTHLDELPQLLNILRGEMGFVGPRPERPVIVAQLRREIRGYTDRLRVKPGVTGLAQTRHRADLDLDDVRRKIRYDRFYLRKRSVFTDAYVLLATIPCAFGFRPQDLRRLKQRLLAPFVRPM